MDTTLEPWRRRRGVRAQWRAGGNGVTGRRWASDRDDRPGNHEGRRRQDLWPLEARPATEPDLPYSDHIVGSKFLLALSGPHGLRASGFARGVITGWAVKE